MKTLECPVCLEVPYGIEVINCIAGHIVCGPCRKKINKCGLCNGEFTTGRNYPMEGIVALLQLKCKNTLCTETVNFTNVEQHSQVCDYR